MNLKFYSLSMSFACKSRNIWGNRQSEIGAFLLQLLLYIYGKLRETGERAVMHHLPTSAQTFRASFRNHSQVPARVHTTRTDGCTPSSPLLCYHIGLLTQWNQQQSSCCGTGRRAYLLQGAHHLSPGTPSSPIAATVRADREPPSGIWNISFWNSPKNQISEASRTVILRTSFRCQVSF